MLNDTPIWALGGESLTAPENTIPAYWAALGSNADGLAIDVRLTGDGIPVCTFTDSLNDTCNDPRKVSKISAEELRGLDAGSVFRSTILNDENQPIGQGKDTPWSGQGKHRSQWLYHPTLSEVLILFSRRTNLLLRLNPAGSSKKAKQEIVNAVSALLIQFGLDRHTIVAADEETSPLVRKSLPDAPLALIAAPGKKIVSSASTAKRLKAGYLIARAEAFLTAGGRPSAGFVKALGRNLQVIAHSDKMPYAMRPALIEKIYTAPWLSGIICRAANETRDAVIPPCKVLSDEFKGTRPNKAIWELGYSKNNKDTKVLQKNGLIIQIKKGGEYSGGAAVTTFSIHGDFDARVAYHVTNPHQGTTFEMAAIQVDPGYRETNLTFDVHGAPPYASSERDENDGFRIGWNNGPALTKFAPTRLTMKKTGADYVISRSRDEAQSSNLYNEYSRDVGYAKKDSPAGELRLVRSGSIFNAYYRDKFNEGWVLSGTALVSTLADDVFLRLGAKHWPKGGIVPPENTITFKNFELYQRRR
jgi:glycerophosphoryl diester phosphodiesterase